MKCNVKFLSVVVSALMALALTNNALAVEGCTQSDAGGASLATTVVNLKGVYACSDIQGRSAITGTITANLDGSINWGSSTSGPRVTEVLVAGTNGGNTCEYVYSGGATNGANLGYKKSTGAYQNVQGVSLCTDGTLPPPPKTIPNCADFSGIDGVTITCPASGAKSIIYNFEVGKPFFNQNGTPMACVCNNGGAPLFECNPNVPAGQTGACPTPTTKIGTEVTTHIEINNDPYVCTTVGGSRTCYYYTY